MVLRWCQFYLSYTQASYGNTAKAKQSSMSSSQLYITPRTIAPTSRTLHTILITRGHQRSHFIKLMEENEEQHFDWIGIPANLPSHFSSAYKSKCCRLCVLEPSWNHAFCAECSLLIVLILLRSANDATFLHLSKVSSKFCIKLRIEKENDKRSLFWLSKEPL